MTKGSGYKSVNLGTDLTTYVFACLQKFNKMITHSKRRRWSL